MSSDWIVYGIENHPDRNHTEFYGPYTREEADAKAKSFEESAFNFNGRHKLYYYHTSELIRI